MSCKITLSDLDGIHKKQMTQVYFMQVMQKREVPVDSATFVFEGIITNEEYRTIEVIYEFKTLFTGIIDSFENVFSEQGVYTILKCRSKMALLVDREAKPVVFNSINIVDIQQNYILPHAFSVDIPLSSRLNNNFTVRKGMSCWSVIELFCIQTFNKRPRLIDGNLISIDYDKNPLTFDLNNTYSSEYPVHYVSYKEDTSDIVTRIFLKSSSGGYTNSISNAYYPRELLKERYLEPNSQWLNQATPQAMNIIEESMNTDKILTIHIPLITQIKIGSIVSFFYEKVYNTKQYKVVEMKEIISDTKIETQVKAVLVK